MLFFIILMTSWLCPGNAFMMAFLQSLVKISNNQSAVSYMRHNNTNCSVLHLASMFLSLRVTYVQRQRFMCSIQIYTCTTWSKMLGAVSSYMTPLNTYGDDINIYLLLPEAFKPWTTLEGNICVHEITGADIFGWIPTPNLHIIEFDLLWRRLIIT